MNLEPEVKRIAKELKDNFATTNKIPHLLILYKEGKDGKIEAYPQDLASVGLLEQALGRDLNRYELRVMIARFGGWLSRRGEKVVATLITGEAWMGSVKVDKKDKEKFKELARQTPSPSQMPDRKEVLMLNMRDKDGNEVQEVYEIKTAMQIKDGEVTGTHRVIQNTPMFETHSSKGACTYMVKDGKKSRTIKEDRTDNPVLEGFWHEFDRAKTPLK